MVRHDQRSLTLSLTRWAALRPPAPTPETDMKTWLEIAEDRGVEKEPDGSINGSAFAAVGIAIINGCPGCAATVAPYNSYQVAEDDPYAWCADCAGVEAS